ncbi:MAG TPA: Crp/Fnr family transcriptional regulator [Bryobacteraceae bacterium]|jgi:CRP/FNR family cyclic AMP-dependent transcriptional regulator|nr:Crp/Fnr family transcriptional regulator [Bryobacteraceae bacterium]
MDAQSISIAAAVRSELVNLDGVTKFTPNRRFATVYSEGSPLDSLFFLESGLVKILKRGSDNKEIILQIVAPGELFGEQALGLEPARSMAAEVLQEGVIYVIPRDLFVRLCDDHPALWREVSALLTVRKRHLEKKIELLCLRDVEYRILYYMADLAKTFGARANGAEYSIPLSQGELASLIGATRETTSTTLNALARRGIIRLGRRQLIVPSIDGVLEAANQRSQAAKVS